MIDRSFRGLCNGPGGNFPETAYRQIGELKPGKIHAIARVAQALLREIEGEEYLERLSPYLAQEPS